MGGLRQRGSGCLAYNSSHVLGVSLSRSAKTFFRPLAPRFAPELVGVRIAAVYSMICLELGVEQVLRQIPEPQTTLQAVKYAFTVVVRLSI